MRISFLHIFAFLTMGILFGSEYDSEYTVRSAVYSYKPLGSNEQEPLIVKLSKSEIVFLKADDLIIEANGSILGVSFNFNAPPRVKVKTFEKVNLLSTSIKGHRSGKKDFSPVIVWFYSFVDEGLHYASVRQLYEATDEAIWIDLVTLEKSAEVPSRLRGFLEKMRAKKREKQNPVDPFGSPGRGEPRD